MNNFKKFCVEYAENVVNNWSVKYNTLIHTPKFRNPSIFHPFSEKNIPDFIRKMKNRKRLNVNDITPYLIKQCVPYTLTLVAYIINPSLEQEIFPSNLNNLWVSPLEKREMTVYRTILSFLAFSLHFTQEK